MGLLSGLFWTLAGGAYATGKLFKDNVNSQGHAHSNIVHNLSWYKKHVLELDHERQRELYQIYKSDLDLFEQMSGRKEAEHSNRYYYSTGMREGSYFETAAQKIAKQEGWLYDKDFRLNPVCKSDASDMAWEEFSKYEAFIDEEQLKFKESVKGQNVPYIGDNYHWWIEGEDTGFLATLMNLPTVTEDSYWQFGNTPTKWQCFERRRYLTEDIGSMLSNLFYQSDGYWHIDYYERLRGTRGRDIIPVNTGVEVTDASCAPTLGTDGNFYYNNRIIARVKVGYQFFKENEWEMEDGDVPANTWSIFAEMLVNIPPYKDRDGREIRCHYIERLIDTKIPIIKHYKLRQDSAFIAKVKALQEAADYGWESDKDEWEKIYKNVSDSPQLAYVAEAHGIIPGPPDPKTLEAERKRRLKAHENPVKLNEWCNLFFDLVYGEEKLRAESPGEYEKLLEKFKEITGEDFVRGVDYLDKLRGLAIADGWYIPEISNKWFDNPPPPEPPEEPYGTAELPTRYL